MELDVFFVSSADEDEDDDSVLFWCTCDGRAHTRLCPLNPRYRGAHSLPSKTMALWCKVRALVIS